MFAGRIAVTRSAEVEALCRAESFPVLRHAEPRRSDTVRLGLTALLAQLVHTGGKTALVCLHDPALALDSCDILVVLQGGGGAAGLALGSSRQKHLFVPEPQNDFIFSIVCEELGFVGACAVVLLFVLLLWRGITIAAHAPDRFGALLVVGFTVQVALQAVLNVAVVTNTIPNTGISLPFFSSGGTSLMMLLGEMGIVLSVSRGET